MHFLGNLKVIMQLILFLTCSYVYSKVKSGFSNSGLSGYSNISITSLAPGSIKVVYVIIMTGSQSGSAISSSSIQSAIANGDQTILPVVVSSITATYSGINPSIGSNIIIFFQKLFSITLCN